jgi:RNA polymerase sigma-70 factor (ECF subfamily)
MSPSAPIEQAFHRSQGRLWGLCYRMTGVAADADELVQETFARALETGRGLAGADLERWLVRVATNLSIDHLRRRRRRSYPGPWLPAPVESFEAPSDSSSASGPGVGVERAERVSYALLIALEALSPRARAAFLLAEVLDYPASEIARVLETTEGNVRVLHHRARRTIDALDVEAMVSPQARERQRHALERFESCMLQQDAAGMEALLVADVRSLTDAGGRYTALREPLVGRGRVARFHLETARRRAPVSTSEIRWINGAAALVVETRPIRPRMAPRLVLRCEVDAGGLIREIHTVLAPAKLTAVRFRQAVDAPPAGGTNRDRPT